MKPLPEGRIKVFKLNDGLCICRFMIFLPEGGTDRFRVDLPDILSQEVFAFFLGWQTRLEKDLLQSREVGSGILAKAQLLATGLPPRGELLTHRVPRLRLFPRRRARREPL